MLNLGTFRKWLFDGGTKLKQDESKSQDMEGYHDVVSKSSELQRQRYRKVVGSFGCALLGTVLFILFTFGYVAFTAKLSHHLWLPTFEYWKDGGKNWHRTDRSVKNNREIGDGLPSITKHELPVLSSHKIDISFRPKAPKYAHQPPMGVLIDPRVHRPVKIPNATTYQGQPFLPVRNRERFPKNDLAVQKLGHERLRKSTRQEAKGSTSGLRRPLRRIPVLHQSSSGHKIIMANDADESDDNFKLNR